jgi:hypothetical protein
MRGMNKMTDKTYRVVIYEYSTGKEEAIIGTNLTEARAERRVETGLMRCNSDYGTKAICEQDGEIL